MIAPMEKGRYRSSCQKEDQKIPRYLLGRDRRALSSRGVGRAYPHNVPQYECQSDKTQTHTRDLLSLLLLDLPKTYDGLA
jgi:hypothetical protein